MYLLIYMSRPKTNRPRKVKANITVDADLWERCKSVSEQDSFINWSQIAETAFRQVLVLRDQILQAHSDGKGVEGMTDAMLLQFQSVYTETVIDAHKNVADYKATNSETRSESTK